MSTMEAVNLSRNEVIARIRAALKKRSGKTWSVTGGTGTAYGWICVDAPPARRTWHHVLPSGVPDGPGQYVEVNTGEKNGHTGPAERAELATLLGLERIHIQGWSIPASSDYRQEAIDRAEGLVPSVVGTPYWD